MNYPLPAAELIPLDDRQETFYIKDISTVFGRQRCVSECQLNSSHVNGVHALIDYRSGSYYISDPGSLNGTYLNGRALPDEEEILLRDGDEIYFADVGYTFRQNEP